MRFRQLHIIYNPISGQGHAIKLAQKFRQRLQSAGWRVDSRPSQPRYDEADPSWILPPETAIICMGGDGTLGGIIPLALRANAVVYMVPLGNESLFARAFAMDREFETLERSLASAPITEMQLPLVEQCYFTSMVSIGLDAEVVAEIATSRRGPIGHSGYILPTLRVLRRFRAAAISVEMDGKRVLHEQPGFLIIGRTAQYARHLALVPEAHATRPVLAARFYPYGHSWNYLRWLPPLCCGRPVSTKGSMLFEGMHFFIRTTNEGVAVQADGDYIGTSPVQIELTEKQLRVLGSPRA